MISRFADALLAVFNGFRRAITDAGHAMGAGLTPHGFSVFHADVVHGTFPGALAAADAGVPRPEGGRFYEASIENRVHRAAHEPIVEVISRGGKGPAGPDVLDDRVNLRFRPLHDFSGRRRLGRVEHGDIIFRHDDLRRAEGIGR